MLVVDDDAAMRRLVRDVLERAGHEVVLAQDVAGARALLHQVFDAAVLDIGLPDGEGFDILAALRGGDAPCASVLMTGLPDADNVGRSIEAGVGEFLAKPYRPAQLLSAVESAMRTTRVFRGRVSTVRGVPPSNACATPVAAPCGTGAPRLRGELSLGGADVGGVAVELAAEGGLTDRERQTLELVLVGASNPQIATQLDISANTVKYHVKNMLTKLGLDSRSDLLRHIVERRR